MRPACTVNRRSIYSDKHKEIGLSNLGGSRLPPAVENFDMCRGKYHSIILHRKRDAAM